MIKHIKDANHGKSFTLDVKGIAQLTGQGKGSSMCVYIYKRAISLIKLKKSFFTQSSSVNSPSECEKQLAKP